VKIGLECAQVIGSFGPGTLSYRPFVPPNWKGSLTKLPTLIRVLVTSEPSVRNL
jgi:hypothetical protein